MKLFRKLAVFAFSLSMAMSAFGDGSQNNTVNEVDALDSNDTLESSEAASVPANIFIENIIQKLEVELRKAKKANQLSNFAVVDGLIKKYILPNIDIAYIAKKVSGDHWKTVVAGKQQQSLQDALSYSLTKTYRLALSSYDGNQIELKQKKSGSKYSLVQVTIKTAYGPQKIDFAMRPKDNSWLVFDVTVNGIAFTKTMQNAIKALFEKGGVTEVVKSLTRDRA